MTQTWINLTSWFVLNKKKPLDLKTYRVDSTERNKLTYNQRHLGMKWYKADDNKRYKLINDRPIWQDLVDADRQIVIDDGSTGWLTDNISTILATETIPITTPFDIINSWTWYTTTLVKWSPANLWVSGDIFEQSSKVKIYINGRYRQKQATVVRIDDTHFYLNQILDAGDLVLIIS